MKGTGTYAYYRCTHYGSGNTRSFVCTAKELRAPYLESVVIDRVTAILSNPETILTYLRSRADLTGNPDRVAEIDTELKDLARQERMLLDLVMRNQFNPALLDERLRPLAGRRAALERERRTHSTPKPVMPTLVASDLEPVCDAIRPWMQSASPDRQRMALEVLQIRVFASRKEIVTEGKLVLDPKHFTTIGQTSALPFPSSVIITPFRDVVPYAA